jgi:PAS domain S-box-containing protein
MADAPSDLQPIDLQLLCNVLPGPFLLLGPDFHIRHVSHAFWEATAVHRPEVVGQPVLTVFAGQPAADLQQALQQARDTQQPRTLTAQRYERPQPGGKRQESYWDWLVTPVPAAEGQLAGFILQASDVTRREQQKEERRNQELLQAIHRNLNDVVWDWDLQANNIWWSDGLHSSFGYTSWETEPTISCWYGRIHPEDGPRVMAGIYQVIDSDLTLWSDVYRFKKKNGEYAEVLTRGSVFRDASGKGYRMIGTIVDITLHRKTEGDYAAAALALFS